MYLIPKKIKLTKSDTEKSKFGKITKPTWTVF